MRKVLLAQLVFLDLKSTLENFLSFRTTDGNVDSDLLVTSNAEGSNSVAGLAYGGETVLVALAQGHKACEVFGQKSLEQGGRTVDWCLTR